MDDKEFQSIIQRLKANDPELRELDLNLSSATSDRIQELAAVLQGYGTLRKLQLVCSSVGPKEAAFLGTALRSNSTLKSLNLSFNQIGTEGAQALAQGLRDNSTLTSLDIMDNNIGDGGGNALAEALKSNSTLTDLNLVDNQIGPEGARALAEGLRFNHTLLRLYLGKNRVDTASAVAITTSLCESKNIIVFESYPISSDLKMLLSRNILISADYACILRTPWASFDFAELQDLWDRRFAVTDRLTHEPHKMLPDEASRLICKAIAPLLVFKDSSYEEYYNVIGFGGLDIVIDHLRNTNQRITPEVLEYQKTASGPRIVDLIARERQLDQVFNYEQMSGQPRAMYALFESLPPHQREQVPWMERLIATLNLHVLENLSVRDRMRDAPKTLSTKGEQGHVAQLNQTRSPLAITGAGRG